jgi:hypothetical protein
MILTVLGETRIRNSLFRKEGSREKLKLLIRALISRLLNQ